MNTEQTKTQEESKQLTVEDLKNIKGGRRRIKAGGRGSINGRPTEFPVDEF